MDILIDHFSGPGKVICVSERISGMICFSLVVCNCKIIYLRGWYGRRQAWARRGDTLPWKCKCYCYELCVRVLKSSTNLKLEMQLEMHVFWLYGTHFLSLPEAVPDPEIYQKRLWPGLRLGPR